MAPDNLALSAPRTREDAEAILETLRGMHGEVGRAPLDPHKAFVTISHVIQADAARVVKMDGRIVGTYGLMKTPWWFSVEEAYFSVWFFVERAHRDGRVAKMLLEDIADRVEEEKIPAYVHVYERWKPGASPVRRIGEEIGFMPSGRLMIVEPREAA